MLGRWTGRALAAGVRSAGRGVSGWPDPNDPVPRDIAAAGVECTEGGRPVQPSCPLLLVCSLDRPKLESGGLRAISGSSEVLVLPNIHLCTDMCEPQSRGHGVEHTQGIGISSKARGGGSSYHFPCP